MLYYQCYCCHSCCSGSTINAQSFTVDNELVVLLIVICILTLVQFVDDNYVAFSLYIYIYRIYIYIYIIYIYSISFSPTSSYILYGRKMRTPQQPIALFASLLLVLLLVLIVIYDCPKR